MSIDGETTAVIRRVLDTRFDGAIISAAPESQQGKQR
jgi:hypothetical protein